MPDKLLDDVIKIAVGKMKYTKNTNYKTYIEAQIHGPVRFKMDVEKMVVSPKYRNNDDVIAKLDEFCRIHQRSYIFWDEL